MFIFHTHLDNSLQHLQNDNSWIFFPTLYGNRSLDWSHYLYISHYPARWDQFLLRIQHNKKMRWLQEIPAVYRQLQHHSGPIHHHIQYPMYGCSIFQHVQCLLHFHQQDEPGVLNSSSFQYQVFMCMFTICLNNIQIGGFVDKSACGCHYYACNPISRGSECN